MKNCLISGKRPGQYVMREKKMQHLFTKLLSAFPLIWTYDPPHPNFDLYNDFVPSFLIAVFEPDRWQNNPNPSHFHSLFCSGCMCVFLCTLNTLAGVRKHKERRVNRVWWCDVFSEEGSRPLCMISTCRHFLTTAKPHRAIQEGGGVKRELQDLNEQCFRALGSFWCRYLGTAAPCANCWWFEEKMGDTGIEQRSNTNQDKWRNIPCKDDTTDEIKWLVHECTVVKVTQTAIFCHINNWIKKGKKRVL